MIFYSFAWYKLYKRFKCYALYKMVWNGLKGKGYGGHGWSIL